MAQLDARMDDFIRLVLEVTGRVRPSDIHGVNADDAADLLRQYRSAHSDQRLVMSGDALIPEQGGPAFHPQSQVPAAAEAFGAPAGPPASEYQQWGQAPQPPVDHALEGNFGTPGAPIGQPVYNAPGRDAVPEAPYGAPMPSPYATPPAIPGPEQASQYPYAAPPQMAPSYPAPSVPVGQAYVEQVPPAGDWQGSAEPFPEQAHGKAASEPRSAWYWWLLPVLFTWLGGLIAWLALRDRQPRAAKRLLITGLVMTVVVIVVLALLVALGMAAFLVPVTPGAGVQSTLTTVTPTP